MSDLVKLAASLILIRPRIDRTYELLLMKRKKGMVFSQAHVFPGGRWEPTDSMSHWGSYLGLTPEIIPQSAHTPEIELNSTKLAAIRETFEESGIFVGLGSLGPPVTGDFLQLCRAKHAKPDVSRLHFVSRIVTPYGMKQRFDTVFFIAFVPADAQFTLTDESESAAWLSPLEVLNLAQDKKMMLLPPQVYLSILLAHYPTVTDLANALDRLTLTNMLPEIVPLPDEKGYIDALPGDDLHPTSKGSGRKHRNYWRKSAGIDFEISPGVVPFIDQSPWALHKSTGHKFTLQPKSRL